MIDIPISSATKTNISSAMAGKPSCILCEGSAGSGKLRVAEGIAADVLGVKDLSTHPYYYHINGSEVGIQEIRELQKKLSLSVPGQSDVRRVVCIENLDQLSVEAQNALLKTLEEPPTDTLIIGCVAAESGALPTVRSRMQQLSVQPVSLQEIQDFYAAKYSDAELRKAYALSGGLGGLCHDILNNSTEHPLVKNIESAKGILRESKTKRLGNIDQIIKSPSPSTADLLDALLRVLVAAQRTKVSDFTAPSELLSQNNRIDLVIKTIDDINKGVSQKLALTRLFLAL